MACWKVLSVNSRVRAVLYKVGRLVSLFPVDLDLMLNLLARSCTTFLACLSIGGSVKLGTNKSSVEEINFKFRHDLRLTAAHEK